MISDLLFKLAGISGKNEIEHDEAMAENSAVDNSRRILTDALGPERRDRVLASIYLVRQDGVAVVRLSAIHVWKALVQNTPRTGNDYASCVSYAPNSFLRSTGDFTFSNGWGCVSARESRT